MRIFQLNILIKLNLIYFRYKVLIDFLLITIPINYIACNIHTVHAEEVDYFNRPLPEEEPIPRLTKTQQIIIVVTIVSLSLLIGYYTESNPFQQPLSADILLMRELSAKCMKDIYEEGY